MTFAELRRQLRHARPFIRVLRSIFAQQGATAARAILNNAGIDLGVWQPVMAQSAETILSPIVNRAFRQFLRDNLTGLRLKPALSLAPFGSIDVPEVREFVKQMGVHFAVTTNKTSAAHTERVREKFREELASGLERGELHRNLTQRLNVIFKNPARTSMIAHNEASRGVHGGQMLAAQRFSEPMVKRWIYSEDACQLCQSLGAMGQIPMEQPFYVHPKGGPYATIMYAPAHPSCFCSVAYEVA
jgi:hypothetical protein